MKTRYNLLILVIAILLLIFSPIYFYMVSLNVTGIGLDLTVLVFIYMTLALGLLLYHQVQMKREYQFQRRANFYNNFYELIKETTGIIESENIYMTILETALRCMNSAERGSILLMDNDTGLLHFVAAVGYDFDILKDTYLELEQSYLYKETGGNISRTVKINRPFEYDKENFEGKNIERIMEAGTYNILTALSTPIFLDGKLYGMLNIDSTIPNDFSNADKEILEMFALELRHVIKHRQSLEKNHYLTNYDTLTGIANRRYIQALVKECHQTMKEQSGNYLIVAIDLDNLKTVNDKYGHDAGDMLLTSFTATMIASIVDGCHFGRNGGDEFLLVIPNGKVDETDAVMKRIQLVLKEVKLNYEGKMLDEEIRFSYGIVEYPSDGEDRKELLKLADSRMYENKRDSKK